MNPEIEKIIPLLLREKDALSPDENDRIKELYSQYGRDAFEEAVRSEKSIRPFASILLSEIGIDADYWKQVHQTYIERNTPIIELLDRVFKNYYDKGGKSLCVVENFGAMLSSGISVGCFASNDVDLTADPAEKAFLVRSFAECGFILDQRGSHPVDNKQISTFHNPAALDGKGWWLNIMWETTSRAYLVRQERFNLRLKEESKRGERYKNTSIRLLRPDAMAYFCALHIAIEHFFSASPGMCLYCDVDRVIRHREINWLEIAKWAKEDRAGNRISLVLDVSSHFLHTPVPQDKFDHTSKVYQELRGKVVDKDSQLLNPQLGKVNRLVIELLSDDKPVISALLGRIIGR